MRTRELTRFKRHIQDYVAQGHDTFFTRQAAINIAAIDKELAYRNCCSYRWELLAEDWGFDYPKQ